MAKGWSVVEIGGKTADAYEPGQSHRPSFGVLHLHGGSRETLRDNAEFTRLFEEFQLACICPHGQRSWWTDRMCPEFDSKVTAERYLLAQVLPFFAERWQIKPPAMAIQGISMGGQGALRVAFRHPELFPVVAAISAAVDYHELYGQGTPLDEMYDSKEQCRQDTVILHIHPAHYPPHIFFCTDPGDRKWYRGNDRLHEKLTALGIPHEIDIATQAGGHSWEYFNSMAAKVEKFVYEALQKESFRLL
jgi:S-formylglutathione hydrolase